MGLSRGLGFSRSRFPQQRNSSFNSSFMVHASKPRCDARCDAVAVLSCHAWQANKLKLRQQAGEPPQVTPFVPSTRQPRGCTHLAGVPAALFEFMLIWSHRSVLECETALAVYSCVCCSRCVPAQLLHGSCKAPAQLLHGTCTAPAQHLHSSCTAHAQLLHGSCS